MRRFILLLVILFLSQVKGYAQNEMKAWQDIKLHFQNKSEEAKKIATFSLDSKMLSEDVITKVQAYCNRVNYGSKEDVVLDSLNFHRLRQSNDSLDLYMSILIKQIEQDNEVLSSKAYPVFKRQFDISSAVLRIAKYDFDQIARKHKSTFLFIQENQTPLVNFD
jgi:hypothetical protein